MQPAELIQLPPVVLTERAFANAQAADIIGIQPDRDAMVAIGQATETGTDWLPDMTIIREHHTLRWDVLFKDAAPATPYLPASELTVTERRLQGVTAGGLREHIRTSGKKLVELTVRDWGALGAALAEAIEEARTGSKGPGEVSDRVVDALGWFVSEVTRQPFLASPSQKRIRAARGIQPYTITRRR